MIRALALTLALCLATPAQAAVSYLDLGGDIGLMAYSNLISAADRWING